MPPKCLYQGLYQTKFEEHHAKPHLSTSILVYLIRATSSVDFKLKLLLWEVEGPIGGLLKITGHRVVLKFNKLILLIKKLRSARVAQVPDLALKKVQCMWRQDWHKCRIRKGCVTLGTGNVCYLAFKIHVMHRSVFFEKRIEGILAGLLVRGAAAPLELSSHPFDLVWTAVWTAGFCCSIWGLQWFSMCVLLY